MKKSFDYEEHGGTPILGIKGIVIKCHGSSTRKSIKLTSFLKDKVFKFTGKIV